MFEYEDDRPRGSLTFIFWTGAGITVGALVVAGALLYAARVLEDQRPGDQGWQFLAVIGVFVLLGIAACGVVRLIYGALLWLVASTVRVLGTIDRSRC